MSSIASAALAGGLKGSTAGARNLLAQSSNLSRDFAAAKTPAARQKVLKPYIDAGIIDGNALSLATGDRAGTAAEELKNVNKTMNMALGPAFNQFDAIMKGLKQSTGMTSEAIFELAMEKNVNLYDTTLSLTDAVQKLGVGMVKTSKQFKDSLRDVQVASLDVFAKFRQSKEMKDALQAAGQTLRGGDTSTEAFLDYYTKLQDYSNYINPESPLTNFIVTAQRMGIGANVGKGTAFGPGGVLEGLSMGGEAQGLIGEAQKQTASGTAMQMSTQLGAMLASSGFVFSDADKGAKATENAILTMINKAMGGDATALASLQKLEGDLARGTALKGKSQSEISAYYNSIFGSVGTSGPRQGTNLFGVGLTKELSGQLDPFKDILTAEAEVMRKGFFDAIQSGFMAKENRPLWWDDAPNWWNTGFEAQLDKDGNISKLVPIGDTQSSQLKKTMGKHGIFNSMVPGNRTVTSSLRNFALGSNNSDHATGHAYDLIGSNLNQYAGLVNASGGFAEFHGSGDGRHLHVVPPVGPMGDTSSSMLSAMSGGTTNYAGDTYNITVNGGGDAQSTARAVAQEIMKMQRNWKQRS
jgi:hypothetical protein